MATGSDQRTVALRAALHRFCAPSRISEAETRALRKTFHDNTAQLVARMDRIPVPPLADWADDDMATRSLYELNKWARTLLAVFVNRNWTLVSHPLIQSPLTEIYPGIYKRYLSLAINNGKKMTYST
jgi:hypothetical protein